jgi:hypothetical protein
MFLPTYFGTFAAPSAEPGERQMWLTSQFLE